VLRLAQAMIDEADRRGYDVTTGKSYGCSDGLVLVVRGHPQELVFVEEQNRLTHEPTNAELEAQARWEWNRPRKWDYEPSGRLQLRSSHDAYSGTLAGDRQRWKLEDRLGHAFMKLEAAADLAEQRHQEALRRAEERQRAWEAAMATAQYRLIEDHRGQVLDEQVQRWREAQDIRTLITQVRAAAAADPDVEVDEAWLAWAEGRADRLDPVPYRIVAPEDPEPTGEALRPYLRGWDPYRP